MSIGTKIGGSNARFADAHGASARSIRAGLSVLGFRHVEVLFLGVVVMSLLNQQEYVPSFAFGQRSIQSLGHFLGRNEIPVPVIVI